MSDKLYQNFLKKWQEVTELPPQQVGPMTPMYKFAVPYFKTTPWKVLVPISLVLVIGVVVLLELTAAQVASLLQRGF